ncbi:hypothetical protein XA68_15128 [Ophiocordyceps unilateralis]|uniref:DRBM domain-containing protein n=1 Tax=Ophiocordyceps unilateralis TaxID=268505 RepID=A0A2A9P7A9_OPHUN|nr:hypothetical protein XA68_15128 [Ophiocordyceps unilateralis]
MESPVTKRVPWSRLRAWIDEHEAEERQNGRPTTLTRTQLEALSRLVPFDQKEPDVSGGDFISLLLHLIQARRLPLPSFVDEAVLVPIDGHMMPKFRCVCSVAEYGSFPCLGLGVEEGWEAPVFQNKKDAKQYAAKYALQYLQQKICTPTAAKNGKKRATSTRPSPAPTPPNPPLRQQQGVSGSPCRSGGNSHSSSSRPNTGAAHDDDEGDLIIRKASECSVRMGFGTLEFVVEPDAELDMFFHARPVFSHGALVPAHVGLVTGVLGKKEARVQVAGKVLLWLEGQKKERATTFAHLFQGP